MPSFIGLATLATLASTISASPFWTPQKSSDSCCLSDADAEAISNAFFTVTGGMGIFDRAVGEAVLADDFSDTSQSVASIVNNGSTGPIDLYGPTLNSKAVFLDENEKQPRSEYKVLNMWHTCDVIVQRFETLLEPQRPRGISVFEVVEAPEGNQFKFQIKQVYGELNSIAWLVSTGQFTPSNATHA